MSLVKSHLTVVALADVNRRYGAIITGLSEAIEEVLADVDDEVAARLGRATRDAEAQLRSLSDAFDAAIKEGKLDVPE